MTQIRHFFVTERWIQFLNRIIHKERPVCDTCVSEGILMAEISKDASLLMLQKEVCDLFLCGEVNPIWDKKKIEQRGKKIIKAAQEIWSIKIIEDLVPDKEEALF